MISEPKIHPDLTAQALKLHGSQRLAHERLLADPRVPRLFGDRIWEGELQQRAKGAALKYYEARSKENPPDDFLFQECSVLAILLQAGIDKGLWTECPPPVPLRMFRHPNTINADVLRRLTPFLKLRAAISDPVVLEGLGTLTALQKVGAVLLWLVLESGLLSSAALRRAIFALQEPVLATGSFHYLELIFVSPRNGRYMMQRVLLGPASALLCMRFRPEVLDQSRPKESTGFVSSQWVWSAIKAYLETLRLESGVAPKTLEDLLRTAKAALLHHGPQLIAGYASGTLASTSLPEDRFRAVIGFAPRGTSRLEWPDPEPDELMLGVERPDIEKGEALLSEVVAPDLTLDEVLAKLDDLREAGPETVLSSVASVALWAADGLRQPSTQSESRRIGVLRTRLVRAVPFILRVCPKIDPESLTTAEASGIYARLLQESRRTGARTKVTHMFREWLNFLLAEAGEKPMSRSGGRPPSANLLTYAEVRRVLSILIGIGSETMDLEIREAAANYVIATVLGLRSAEWMGLRTIDAQILHAPTLSVLAYLARRLKSAASNRVVPIGLLPPDLESRLLSYLGKAWSDWATPRHEHLVSRGDGARLAEHHVEAVVRSALKKGCADPTITKHHGRHSAASLLTLAMLAHLIDLRGIRDQLGDLGESIDRADQIRELLVGPEAGYRDALTALSVVIGHSWLVTTCESYVHVLDICLFATLRGYAHESDVGLLRIATGLSASTVRANRTSTIAELLRMAERRWPENVHRDDTPYCAPSAEPGLVFAQHLETAWHQIGAGESCGSAGNRAAARGRIVALAQVRTAKRGSEFCPHRFTGSPAGEQMPVLPVNSEAARGAIRSSALLRSLIDERHPDLPWALTRFAAGLQSKEGRVTLDSYDEVRRFSELLVAGGTDASELLYGKGNALAYGLPGPIPPLSQNGRFWISICSVPKDQRSERRDFTGAVWAWTMTYVLQPELAG